jgi:hypothetical protein
MSINCFAEYHLHFLESIGIRNQGFTHGMKAEWHDEIRVRFPLDPNAMSTASIPLAVAARV